MDKILQIILAILLPVVVTIGMLLLSRKTPLGRLSYLKKQLIYGFVFGLVSIGGSEFGIDIGTAIINVRDAAPICAGLIFGGPAGIIAGCMGGIERYYAVFWGAGTYTREACAIATVCAGLLAAFLRRYMFERKKPSWYFGPFVALIVEVMHMLLVFAIHNSHAKEAFIVVQSCAIPMILMNALAVGLSFLAVSILLRERRPRNAKNTRIFQTFQKWLLICLSIAFAGTSAFTVFFETRIYDSENSEMLQQGVQDALNQISEESDNNLLNMTEEIASSVQELDTITVEALQKIALAFNVPEINVVDERGMIRYSSIEEYVGYDMTSGEQSKEFMCLATGECVEYVQEFGPVSYDETVYRKYAGAVISNHRFVQVGIDSELFYSQRQQIIQRVAHNRHIGEAGFLIVADHTGKIVSKSAGYVIGDSLNGVQPYEEAIVTLNKEVFHCYMEEVEGYKIYALRSQSEEVFTRDMSVYLMTFMEILIFGILFIVIYILIKEIVVKNIYRINEKLAQITGGNLDVYVDVESNEEFASLSRDINSTVDTLKRYIDEASARIDAELQYAKNIQYSSLPHIFPPFPDRKDFEVYASMNTAKEVGGDFYDFYFVDQNRLAILIADVSGKGIPAALFMMRAKTSIKNLASTGMPVNEVLMKANNGLCEDNETSMFVTAWLGIVDLNTGVVSYANAGHNFPVLYRREALAPLPEKTPLDSDPQGFHFVKSRPGLVLGGMEDVPYRANEIQLQHGDFLFLYTDGVVEANNSLQELYGDDRLMNYMNSIENPNAVGMEAVCKDLQSNLDVFVGESDQFDDITMLAFRYH